MRSCDFLLLVWCQRKGLWCQAMTYKPWRKSISTSNLNYIAPSHQNIYSYPDIANGRQKITTIGGVYIWVDSLGGTSMIHEKFTTALPHWKETFLLCLSGSGISFWPKSWGQTTDQSVPADSAEMISRMTEASGSFKSSYRSDQIALESITYKSDRNTGSICVEEAVRIVPDLLVVRE